MADDLAETLRRIRGLKGESLRQVEKKTGISNAYLSQLEGGDAKKPSPHILFQLAEFYEVPYESLMEAAGYLKQPEPKKAGHRRVGAIGAALMSARLSPEEEAQVAEYIQFLRTRGPRAGK